MWYRNYFITLIILVREIYVVKAQNEIDNICGVSTTEHQFPWLVGILSRTSDGRHDFFELQCAGALINRRHVVSTAQCNLEVANVVRFGPNPDDSSMQSGKINNNIVPIQSVIRHPEYIDAAKPSNGSFHDVALIILRDIITFTNAIRPICLSRADIMELDDSNVELHLAAIYASMPEEFNRRRLGAAMTLDKEEYQRRGILDIMAKNQISADFVEIPPLLGVCMATGSLLMNKRNDRYELIGLLDGQGIGWHILTIFTPVYPYNDWIRRVTPDWAPCGRRRVEDVELIVNGEDTKDGDWPWHVAIFRTLKSKTDYICGGTLISKTMVLTAAHCTTINGEAVSPNILTVELGKYYLMKTTAETQEKVVIEVIVHENFRPRNHFENDISLLKLKTEVVYTDYVQRACIWYKEDYERLPDNYDYGTVVGWGINQSDVLSSVLKQAKLPKISDSTCKEKNVLFYNSVLSNNKKFCAGWANGTSPCNGDSGGGFLVFVPDRAKDSSADALGSWYIRGIVSLTASLKNHARCDPYQYVVLTDVEKYTDWIKKQMSN